MKHDPDATPSVSRNIVLVLVILMIVFPEELLKFVMDNKDMSFVLFLKWILPGSKQSQIQLILVNII